MEDPDYIAEMAVGTKLGGDMPVDRGDLLDVIAFAIELDRERREPKMRTVIVIEPELPLDPEDMELLAREAGFFLTEKYEFSFTYSVETIEA